MSELYERLLRFQPRPCSIELCTYFLTLVLFTFCTCCIYMSFVHCCHLRCMCYVCIAVFTLDEGLLARSQYLEGPATGHLDTGYSWFPCVYTQTLRWFPKFQVVTTCFSCSPPDLNLLVTNFIFCIHVK